MIRYRPAGIVRPLRRAFTLIELLVVVVVIGILAALALPGIQGARRSARRTQCLNNMRNVGTGIANYVSHNTKYPASGMWDPNPNAAQAGATAGIVDEYDLKDPSTGWQLRQPGGNNASSPLITPAASMNPANGVLFQSWVVDILPHISRSDVQETWDPSPSGSKRFPPPRPLRPHGTAAPSLRGLLRSTPLALLDPRRGPALGLPARRKGLRGFQAARYAAGWDLGRLGERRRGASSYIERHLATSSDIELH